MARIEQAIRQPEILEQQLKPKEESIFNHYSVENEADFLRKIQLLPESQRKLYVWEQITGFLGEYVGHIPYKKITYLLKPDGLYFADISMSKIYSETMNLAGANSREWNENVGMLKVQQQLLEKGEWGNDTANVATIFSPPKYNYAFAFHFQKAAQFDEELDAIPVTEYILRYPEKKGELSQTNRFATSYDPINAGYYLTEQDFLKNPFVSFSQNHHSELTKLMKSLGITDKTIQESQKFESTITAELSERINRYCQVIFEAASLTGKPGYSEKIEEAKLRLTVLFHKAQEIKDRIDNGENPILRRVLLNEAFSHVAVSDDEELKRYSQKPAMVAGGDCPVVGKNGLEQEKFVTVSDIHAKILRGNSPENIMHDVYGKDSEPFVCPRCNKETQGPVGNQCPKCGLTKEKAAEEGYITCD